MAFAVAGALVAVRHPRNPIGWLLCGAGLFLAITILVDAVYWHIAFHRPGQAASAEWLLWIENWSWIPVVVPLFTMVPLLFPTGAPLTPRWRSVVWVAAGAGSVLLVSSAFAPGPLENYPWVDNPFGIDGLGLGALVGVGSSRCRWPRRSRRWRRWWSGTAARAGSSASSSGGSRPQAVCCS